MHPHDCMKVKRQHLNAKTWMRSSDCMKTAHVLTDMHTLPALFWATFAPRDCSRHSITFVHMTLSRFTTHAHAQLRCTLMTNESEPATTNYHSFADLPNYFKLFGQNENCTCNARHAHYTPLRFLAHRQRSSFRELGNDALHNWSTGI